MINSYNNIPRHLIFLHPEKYNSFSLDDKLFIFQQWIVFTLLSKIKLPRTFTLCPENKVVNMEKTDIILTKLLIFLSKYPFGHTALQKLSLENALTKEQELGNFLELQKLPGSKYYFAKTEEELNEYLLLGSNIFVLILKDFQIQDIPEDTIIFIDRIPTETPFKIAQEIILKDIRADFEENLNAGIEETIIKNENRSKEDLFERWLLKAYKNNTEKELQEYFLSMIDYDKK